MSLTQEDILRSGYHLPAAPPGAWRTYDENDPVPGYFQFDWLSSRHPDLYHQFSLSTMALMDKLETLFDLTGSQVVDIGAGTGRSTAGAARKADSVFAVELYTSVIAFGHRQLQKGEFTNAYFIQGSRDHLPLPESSVDVAISAWAELNLQEAYRVLKPGGSLIQLGAIPTALCGEVTSELLSEYDWLPRECAPAEVFEPDYPDTSLTADSSIWEGIPASSPIHIHQFTYVADYLDYSEAAAMLGRLYGPKARRYFLSRKQSTFAWRLQVILGQIRK